MMMMLMMFLAIPVLCMLMIIMMMEWALTEKRRLISSPAESVVRNCERDSVKESLRASRFAPILAQFIIFETVTVAFRCFSNS